MAGFVFLQVLPFTTSTLRQFFGFSNLSLPYWLTAMGLSIFMFFCRSFESGYQLNRHQITKSRFVTEKLKVTQKINRNYCQDDTDEKRVCRDLIMSSTPTTVVNLPVCIAMPPRLPDGNIRGEV